MIISDLSTELHRELRPQAKDQDDSDKEERKDSAFLLLARFAVIEQLYSNGLN